MKNRVQRVMDSGDHYFSNKAQSADIAARIMALREEHQALDLEVGQLQGPAGDQLRRARLKKRKLAIKDEIRILEDRLCPDIIA